MSDTTLPPTWIKNVRLLDPASRYDGPGSLLIKGDRIADVGPQLIEASIPEDAIVLDGEGVCLSPGLIDFRAHCGEPGNEGRETMATASRSAAAGGVTTLVAMPNTQPVVDDPALVDYLKRRAKDAAIVRIEPTAAITKGLMGEELAEMGLLAEAGAVAFSDGDHSIEQAQILARAMSYSRFVGKLIIEHCLNRSLGKNGSMNSGELATRLGLAGIPTQAETILVERDLRLVEMTGAAWHGAGLSTKQAAEAVARAKKSGLNVTAGIAPYHFALNENAVHDYRTFAKVSPPLRAEDDRQAMVAALKDGTIDIICSHHVPLGQDAKRQPFAEASFGAAGIELLLPISLELYHNGHMSLLEVLSKLTCNPADRLGFTRGRLKPGAVADLCLFDPGIAWKIDRDLLRSKGRNTPFDRRPTQGKVLKTWVGGKIVFDTAAV